MVTGEPPYDWISLQEAAERLGIYHRTLLKRINRGEVLAHRIGPKLIRLRVHELDGEASPTPPVRVEPTGRVLDTDSAATYLGLGETAFRTIVRRGEIAHTLARQRGRLHGWRFTDFDLHNWLEERARVRPGDLRHLDTAG